MGAVFKLKNPKAKKSTLIYFLYFYDGKKFVASTRRSIHPDMWDKKRQRPKKSYPYHDALSAYLTKLEKDVTERHFWLMAQGQTPTNQHFRNAMEAGTGRLELGRPTLIQHLDNLCVKAPARSMYHRLRTQVQRFVKAKGAAVEMASINGKWFNDFQAYLIQNCEAEQYAYRLAKQFRTVIRLTTFEWPGKAEVLAQKLTASDAAGESTYLTFDELAHLRDFEFTSPILSAARNALLFASLTGLRISDWSKLDPSGAIEVDGFKFVRVVMQKTRTERRASVAYPPLLPMTEKLISNGIFPPEWQRAGVATLTTFFNRSVREMAEAAGFTDQVEIVKRSRGETITEKVRRCDLFSSKIGRKSFNSNLRSLGCPDQLIGVMTGHSTGSAMAGIYDARKFRDIAPQLIPYLKAFELKFPRNDSFIHFI